MHTRSRRERGLSVIISVVLGWCAVSQAADSTWDGGGANDLYMNSLNWVNNTLPAYQNRIILNENNGTILVQSGNALTPLKILGPSTSIPGTPVGITTMTFTGGSLTNFSYWNVSTTGGGTGVVNISGSTRIYTRDLILAREGGRAFVNMAGGNVEVYGTGSGLGLIVGGDDDSEAVVRISGGTLTAYNLTFGEKGLIDIMKSGTLKLVGDWRSVAEAYIAQHKIMAEHGGANVTVTCDWPYMYTYLTSSGGITHTIAASAATNFFAWPANNGIWSWGNEIVVGFNRRTYQYNPTNHSGIGNTEITMQARSSDGGTNWTLEYPDNLDDHAVAPLSYSLYLDNSQFAFKARDNGFWYSYNKAASWIGPFLIPDWGHAHDARTDYIVLSSNTMKIFLVSDEDPTTNNVSRANCAQTTNGLVSIEPVNWMCPCPATNWGPNNYKTMPSTVKISSSTYISAIRCMDKNETLDDRYIDIYKTTNGGTNWTKIATAADNVWNPGSLIKLADGRLCLTYGCRYAIYGRGIRAKMSSDNGVTWSAERILRCDGGDQGGWDIGYPRSVQRPDGKVVTVYYYSTIDRPQQHIAATIWTP